MDTKQGGDNALAASGFLIVLCPLSGVLLGYHHTLTVPKIPLLSLCQTSTYSIIPQPSNKSVETWNWHPNTLWNDTGDKQRVPQGSCNKIHPKNNCWGKVRGKRSHLQSDDISERPWDSRSCFDGILRVINYRK